MRVGALVKIKWFDDSVWSPGTGARAALGVVRDYRPNVLGGSSTSSSRRSGAGDRQMQAEFNMVPKRGEVLVLCYEDGGESWYDESNVELVPEE